MNDKGRSQLLVVSITPRMVERALVPGKVMRLTGGIWCWLCQLFGPTWCGILGILSARVR